MKKMITLHKGDGKTPVKIDFNKLCIDFIKNKYITFTPPTVQRVADTVDRGGNNLEAKDASVSKRSRNGKKKIL